MITARSLTRTFDRTVALRDLSLTIETGEMFALIGPDGAGKTTFFRIVTGLLRPTRGELRMDGHESVGFVPQRFALYPDLTIDENLGTRDEILNRYPRPLVEVRSANRMAVRSRLAEVADIDDVSLFGTVLHVRGRAGADETMIGTIRATLDGLVSADAIATIRPSLEDVFVLQGETAGGPPSGGPQTSTGPSRSRCDRDIEVTV